MSDILPQFFPLLIGLILVAAPSWVLGWHYGARSFKDRTVKWQKALAESNKVYSQWADTPHGREYEAGYAQGLSDTLNTLAAFLDRAEVKNASSRKSD